jgi:hypothetical protein
MKKGLDLAVERHALELAQVGQDGGLPCSPLEVCGCAG